MKKSDTTSASSVELLKAWPQYLMPGHLLSRLMHRLTRVRWQGFRLPFTRWFAGHFRIDMSEAAIPDLQAYEHFNAFFTRALRPDARPPEGDANTLVSPVDAVISQMGEIAQGRLIQAKGHDYGLLELLGNQTGQAALFEDGSFATLYLSPRDYHRIHMPITGTLREMLHIPGRLFSVNAATTRHVPRLFARNERVVAFFDTAAGPMAMVLVGAVFVGSIETVWNGVVTPPAGRLIRNWQYNDDRNPIRLQKGEEMGRFNMGSTVILLFGKQAIEWLAALEPEARVRVGQAMARVQNPPDTESS